MVALLLAPSAPTAQAQVPYDGSWYDASQPYVKISVTEDGLHRVSGADLQQAGANIGQIAPQTLRLLEKGDEVPLHLEEGDGDPGTLSAADGLVFVGRRNRGTDEAWAYYKSDLSNQSSPFHSLYSDTRTYWLTWGDAEGRRYETADPAGNGPVASALRDTLHLENDERYFSGSSSLEAEGNPFYTRGEGYYWHLLDRAAQQGYTFSLDRRSSSDHPLHLSVRLTGATGSCHRATLEVSTGGSFQALDEKQWRGYDLRTLRATLSSNQIDGTAVEIRVQTYEDGFDELADCDPETPNQVLVDWAEVSYRRQLVPAGDGQQRFVVSGGQEQTVELNGYAGGPVQVFDPAAGRRFELDVAGDGTARFSDTPAGPIVYWVARSTAYHSPSGLSYEPPGTQPDWYTAENRADYVILTTEALRASAEQMASYRESHNGFAVAVATVEEIYDQFDYGRPTPIAIRRFVHRTQAWTLAPDYLALWGDAAHPIRTQTNNTDAPWNVLTFGFAASDAWYAMQFDGPNDWSEVLALGRVTLRSNDQAGTFLQKIQTYESAPLSDWQKRMLLLSGGTSAPEQNRLQAYSTDWGEIAAGRPTGMDTIYFAKQSDAPLDPSFQDSLSQAIGRGAGWLNYFGHAAAETWEIVTEPIPQFDNAARLPFVVSLACQTGAFARTATSFGEELVSSHLDGGIGHFGTSYRGNIGTSARINDVLIARVFKDTMRVMGKAIQQAKAQLAGDGFVGTQLVQHLLQYNLLGDPATRLALPEKPNLHLSPGQISFAPLAPVPSDSLGLTVRLKNQGLIPPDSDSVALRLTHRPPGGPSATREKRLAPFALQKNVTFQTLLTERMVGANRFSVAADPLDRIAEAREDDNVAEKTTIVFSEGLQVVTPSDLSLISDPSPTFRVGLRTTAGADTSGQRIRFELAPSAGFARPIATTVLAATGPLVKWTPNVTLEQGRTYYWRSRLAEADSTGWRPVSFTVTGRAAADGWLQQGAQFGENAPHRQLQRTDGQWAFDRYNLQVVARSGFPSNPNGFTVGGTRSYVYLKLGFGLLVIDGQTGQVKDGASFCTEEISNAEFRENACAGSLDGQAAIDSMAAFIDATLEEGDHLFTRVRRINTGDIPTSVERIFQCLGEDACLSQGGIRYSQEIGSLVQEDLWIMQARKGAPEETVERVARSARGGQLFYQTSLTFTHPSGRTTAPRIGPALQWNALNWQETLEDAGDDIRIDVLSGDGSTTLIDNLTNPDASHDLSNINAEEHPYLRLRATFSDSTARTAPQLEQWRLSYAPPAELALDVRRLELPADTLAEDQTVPVSVPVVNLSDTTSQPVHVTYAVTDSSNQTRTVATDTLRALGPEEEAVTRATITATALAGESVLTIRARQSGQPVEPISFNNTLVKTLFVRPDRTAPNVRVSANGRGLPHDPEPVVNLQDPALPFVARKPTFEIVIDDNNEFAAFDDTSLVEVRLDDRRVPFSSADLQFKPPEAPGKAAHVLFTPVLAGQDTVHTLRVEVQDEKGNAAEEYQTHFRVKTEVVVRDLYPYPNPMHTRTDFSFRLQGSDVSKIEECRLRIYTLSGRLIREFDVLENPMLINPEDGGGLRPGWNKIPWNGRDADGDRVATGVYLYKVFMKGEGDLSVNDGDVEKVAVIR